MKPIISEMDYKLLYDLLKSQKTSQGKDLGQEITNAKIVKDEDMDKKIIRLNSQVEVQEMANGKKIKLKIVMPDCVDLKNHRISVFSPLSVALIGYKENDLIPWTTTAGKTSFKIIKVLND
ncbi:MAG: GreA/GreB family elongation factor [Bacteroidia bacterium]|nr:GreA/GreB family elongation factor [Bacteroidia bacterium]